MARPEVKVRITGQNDSAAALRSVESSLNRIKGVVRTLGIGLSAAAIGQFFRKAVEESASAGAALARVQTAVGNTGQSFAAFQAQIDETVSRLQRLTRFSDDDGREALAAMISITGDVTASIRNLGLAANIASARKIELRVAADLVGRAMTGETALLKRYGIQVKEGTDAIATMQATFKDFAENEGKTFQGRTAQLANAFSDLQEAIGDVLTSQDTLGGALPQIIDLFDRLAKAVKRNENDLRRFLSTVTAGVVAVVRVLANALQLIHDTFAGMVAGLVLLVGTAINEGLIRPLNDFLALVRAPFRAPEFNISHAREMLDEAAANTLKNWGDIKDALLDVASAFNSVGTAADTATGGGGGGGGGGGDPPTKGKKFDNTASRGTGNTVAGGGLRGGIIPPPSINGRSAGSRGGKSPLREALEAEAAEALAALQEIQGQLAQGIADSLGDGIANGFAAALGKGGIGAGFKALTQTLLAGVGQAMVQFGKASLAASTLMLKIKAALATLNPAAAIAASLAMIAIGGLISGAASSAFGGSSSSGFASRGLSDTITRVQVSPTPSSQSTASLAAAPAQQHHYHIIGTDDPRAQRELVTMMQKAADRGHKVRP